MNETIQIAEDVVDNAVDKQYCLSLSDGGTKGDGEVVEIGCMVDEDWLAVKIAGDVQWGERRTVDGKRWRTISETGCSVVANCLLICMHF